MKRTKAKVKPVEKVTPDNLLNVLLSLPNEQKLNVYYFMLGMTIGEIGKENRHNDIEN